MKSIIDYITESNKEYNDYLDMNLDASADVKKFEQFKRTDYSKNCIGAIIEYGIESDYDEEESWATFIPLNILVNDYDFDTSFNAKQAEKWVEDNLMDIGDYIQNNMGDFYNEPYMYFVTNK